MPYSTPADRQHNSESSGNEGGSLAPDALAEPLGVVRHVTETYSVGAFRYTNIDDAIAQARRMTRLEQDLL